MGPCMRHSCFRLCLQCVQRLPPHPTPPSCSQQNTWAWCFAETLPENFITNQCCAFAIDNFEKLQHSSQMLERLLVSRWARERWLRHLGLYSCTVSFLLLYDKYRNEPKYSFLNCHYPMMARAYVSKNCLFWKALGRKKYVKKQGKGGSEF